jgi:tetratricopeptide (TPR) repeat protein
MDRPRIVLGVAVASLLAAAILFGGLLTSSESRNLPRPPEAVAAAKLLAGFSPGDTAVYARDLERRAERNPGDARLHTLLGLTYQQLARETGDLSYYERSEEALERALRIAPRDHLATTGKAALAASRHRFREALVLARNAVSLSPSSAAPYGILGDSNLELGRYEEAFAAFDRMVSLKPSAASYARVSYGREILGDTIGAIEAMELAVEAAQPTAEPVAWALANVAALHLGSGRLIEAERRYRLALERLPAYAPALAGLARVNTYRGREAAAARLYKKALAASPAPEYAVALGDSYAALDRPSEAATAWARADALERDFALHGGRNELETALFDLDHDRSFEAALARAEAGQRRRPSVEGEHVLAWALFKNGRCTEARVHSIRALRLGTKDVGALMHRSLIERCLGNEAASEAFRARAFAINPYARFELGSPRQGGNGARI